MKKAKLTDEDIEKLRNLDEALLQLNEAYLEAQAVLERLAGLLPEDEPKKSKKRKPFVVDEAWEESNRVWVVKHRGTKHAWSAKAEATLDATTPEKLIEVVKLANPKTEGQAGTASWQFCEHGIIGPP